mmetsp:Transcript_30105/g.54506  ORF Transcript_30105/g.54506 Transcript_30105/m.54506 type:complete len:828 (-) Transcript_30105:167-2650(-)
MMAEFPKRFSWLQVGAVLYLAAALDADSHSVDTLEAVEVGSEGDVQVLSGASLLDLASEGNSLSDVSFAARVGHGDPICQKKLAKVEKIMHFEAQRLIAEGLGPHQMNLIQAVSEALVQLKNGETDEKTLELILVGLGNVTLKTALQMGEVWTASDQSDLFYYCFPGLVPSPTLEESNLRTALDFLFKDITAQQTMGVAQPKTSDQVVFPSHDIYYCYRPGTTDAAKRAFVAARRHIQEQVPCITFKAIKPRLQTTEEDLCEQERAIMVRDHNSGCWSQNRQYGNGSLSSTVLLNIGRGCEMKGMVVGQLGKILGLRRELRRADRDAYVNLHPANLREKGIVDYFKIWTPPEWRADSAPPAEAYVNDPFDFLSITFDPAQAFTNGTNFVETPNDPQEASFLGQRMGLSELDVEELVSRYDCHTNLPVQNPTRVLSANFLAGTALTYDGTCKDRMGANLGFLAGEAGKDGCRVMTTELCRGSGFERMRTMCPLSCLFCIPAVPSMVEQRNHLIHRQDVFRYCDDHGCQIADAEGELCKQMNPKATKVNCSAKVYCDDDGCLTTDVDGRSCREKNPNAKEIACAVTSRGDPLKNGSTHPVAADRVHVSTLQSIKTRENNLLRNSECVDANVTGIKFKHGNKATCLELKGYCNHTALGSRVRQKCAATCAEEGYHCGESSEKNSSMAAVSPDNSSVGSSSSPAHLASNLPAQGCVDLSAETKPVLMKRGKAQSCPDIRSYCLNHANSYAVQQKCPLTCASCVPEAPAVGYAAPVLVRYRDGMTETTTSTTSQHIEWKSTPALPDENHSTATGCDRRRRWGFCYSRRRSLP